MDLDLNKVICHCMNVTGGDIKNAIDEGAKDFEEVQEITQCSTGCGTCRTKVEKAIEELKGQ